jgi:hypothetical protein
LRNVLVCLTAKRSDVNDCAVGHSRRGCRLDMSVGPRFAGPVMFLNRRVVTGGKQILRSDLAGATLNRKREAKSSVSAKCNDHVQREQAALDETFFQDRLSDAESDSLLTPYGVRYVLIPVGSPVRAISPQSRAVLDRSEAAAIRIPPKRNEMVS